MRDCIFYIAIILSLIALTEAEVCRKITKEPITKVTTCEIEKSKDLIYSISSVRVLINCSDCEILHGASLQDVKKSQSTWNKFLSNILSAFSSSSTSKESQIRTLRFSPFVDKCILIKPKRNTTLHMRVDTVVDLTCLACLISGLLLFFSAPSLSSSVKFYYTGGVGIGVLASVLIVIFILSRFIPKKPAAYTILLGGWSMTAFIMAKLYENWQSYLLEYQNYFLAYIAIAGFLSFALCYWKGPVEDPRSQRIIQWAIQLIGLTLLYNGTQSHVVSTAIVSCVLIGSLWKNKPSFQVIPNFPSIGGLFKWRRKLEPPRLLTEEEYRIQGEIETKKALEELRKYCDSPQWSPHRWKTMSRLKSPSKFAGFVDGEDHVSDAEMTLHDAELTDAESELDLSLVTDDDDNTDSDNNGDAKILNNGKRKGNNGVTLIKRVDIEPEISEDED